MVFIDMFTEDLGYEKKGNEKVRGKWRQSWSYKNEDKYIFCYVLIFRSHALQSKRNKVIIANFFKFRLHSMRSKIEQAFEKITKFP